MRRLLLIGDERPIASFVRQGVEEEGYAVMWAEAGREGLHQAATEAFDALLLHVRLPDASGVDVCRKIRRRNAALPILTLRALDVVSDRVAGLRAGAADYFGKPFEFDELLARLEALLRRSAVALPAHVVTDGPRPRSGGPAPTTTSPRLPATMGEVAAV